ncbi:MAG: FkbM family methyltransferase [Candidatus Micrarchaeota archaeon]
MDRVLRGALKPFMGRGLGARIPGISKIYGFVMNKRIGRCEIDGMKMFVDMEDRIVSNELFYKGVFEPEETALLKELVRPGSVFVDVGAHIGYYTLLAAKRKAKVYAFEPQGGNFSLLKRNVHANGFTNVFLYRKAVSDRGGRKVKLYCNVSNKGNNSIFAKDVVDKYGEEEVGTATLDGVLGGKKVDLMKIDVEGAEINVLKGAGGLIEKNPGMKIVVEFTPAFYGFTAALPEFLEKKGFSLKVVSGKGYANLKKLDEKTLKDVIRISRKNAAYNINLLCERQTIN